MNKNINSAYRKIRDSKSDEDTNMFHDLKRTVQRETRKSYNNYMENIIDPDLDKGNKKIVVPGETIKKGRIQLYAPH